MFINNKLPCFEQQRIQKYAKKTDSYKFFTLLTSPKLLNTVEDLLLDHRERLYPPTETLSMFLAQALSEDSSCQKAVNAAAIQRAVAWLQKSMGSGNQKTNRVRLDIKNQP